MVKKENKVKIIENKYEQSKEIIEIEEHKEPIESKWTSYYSFNIIDLFSDIRYDFNILFRKCNINNFFDLVINNSTIYDPHEKHDESDSEEEDIDYYSD